jgi:hypothetical protein
MKRNHWTGMTLAIGLVLAIPLANADVTAKVELGLTNLNKTATQTCAGCVAEATGNINTPPIGFSTSGVARASADYGTLRAYGSFQAFGPHTGTVTDVVKANAMFQDSFIINDVALNGTPGVVDIPIAFAWSVIGSSAYPPGTSFAAINQLTFRFFAPNNDQIIGSFFREDFDTSGSLGKGAYTQVGTYGAFVSMPFTFTPTISVNFIFGQAIKVISTLDIVMSANDYNPSGSTSLFGIDDAGNSAYWGGFAAVRAANGSLVQDYTVQSGSGANWALSSIPVPEPSSWAMMLAGLGLVLPLLRWRKMQKVALVGRKPAV